MTQKFFLVGLVVLVFQKNFVQAQTERIELSFGTGYQRENFNWSIAGDSVNILSELKWKNVRGPKVDFSVTWNIWRAFLLQGDFTNTFITAGTSTDTDYSGNDRTMAQFDQMFRSNKGSVTTWRGMIGCHFFEHRSVSLIITAGWSESWQHLYILDYNGNSNYQLNTTYKTTWSGMAFGVAAPWKIRSRVVVEPSINYCQLNYDGKANWNLIETFQHPISFRHTAKGFCIEPSMKFRYSMSSCSVLFLKGYAIHWETGKGVDKLYRVDGQIVSTQLNAVHCETAGLTIGVEIKI